MINVTNAQNRGPKKPLTAEQRAEAQAAARAKKIKDDAAKVAAANKKEEEARQKAEEKAAAANKAERDKKLAEEKAAAAKLEKDGKKVRFLRSPAGSKFRLAYQVGQVATVPAKTATTLIKAKYAEEVK